jgi:hypothetical protein
VTQAPTMPVAVANMAQVAMVASASDAGTGPAAAAGLEQAIENAGALDDVAHEDEQGIEIKTSLVMTGRIAAPTTRRSRSPMAK